jgi:predicted DNA binding CopG/RHH family protein
MSIKLSSKGKKLPKFKSDEEMVRFVETHDMSDYINSKNFVPAHEVFEFAPKDTTVTMRFPIRLLNIIKKRAAKKQMPYQRFIRVTMENAMNETRG